MSLDKYRGYIMENNDNDRTYPTGPGWWWRSSNGRRSPISAVEVFIDGDELVWHDGVYYWLVEDDGHWLGPIPLPGEWAPRKLFETLRYELGASVTPRIQAQSVWLQARAWSNANPEPEVMPCKCTFAQRMAGAGCDVCNPAPEENL